MKYVDDYRETKAALALRRDIEVAAAALDGRRPPVHVMEVCGSHTMAIARYGIRSLLPSNLRLISGPGCPVCVTDAGYIDTAIELAGKGHTLITFGDMLKVPGSESSLAACRAAGAAIKICYSPLEALRAAEANPNGEIVFLAIGFETTVAPVLTIVDQAIKKGIKNLSLLTAFKVVPPALEALASDPEVKLDAFLCPAHVSAIIGARAYTPVAARFGLPCVIAGFEPLDILLGLKGILLQLAEGAALVENQYNRVVKENGNQRALQLIARYLEPVDALWRGIGLLPQSGLALRPEFEAFDAVKRHGVQMKTGRVRSGCRCGDVLKGLLDPQECPLFGRHCNPRNAIGPCMVSSEGSCAAAYKYGSFGEYHE